MDMNVQFYVDDTLLAAKFISILPPIGGIVCHKNDVYTVASIALLLSSVTYIVRLTKR